MQDLVALGTGNSRLMKSNISPSTTLSELISMLNNGTFPYDIGPLNAAGISQQGTALNKATLLKDATAALFGLGTDAVPDDVLKVLSQAALYKTVTLTAQLGTLAEGTIIYLNENGSPVPFYVAKQGYEPSYNTDRVLVVRKNVYDQRQWNISIVNAWATSSMRSWLNSTYKALLDSDIQEAMGTTTYRYTPGNGNRNVSTRSDSVFLLSATELGKSESWFNVEGTTLPNATNYQIATLNSSAVVQWTRSPNTNSTTAVTYLNANGVVGNDDPTSTYGSRPAFTLPTTFMASLENTTGLYDPSNNLLLKLPGVQIETGSYVGTGTYGASNPNSLTFGFVPKILKLSIREESNVSYEKNIFSPFVYPSTNSCVYSITTSTSVSTITVSWEGKTVKWYSTNSIVQGNSSTAIIDYYAIG